MKPKKLFILLCLILTGAATASAAMITNNGTQPSVGNGNRNNPYEIRTAEELRWFVHYENTRHWYPNDYAKLMADIDLSSICGPDKGSWIPLGYSEESGAKDHWYGSLDGNGYTVSGLYIDGNDFMTLSLGFCGKVSEAKICNLTVKGEIRNAADYTGGLVGWNYEDCATIDKCASNVDIYIGATDAQVGGLIGRCTATGTAGAYYITNCTYEGKIVEAVTGFSGYSGTLIGYMKGTSGVKACSGYCGYKDAGGSSFIVPLIGYANSAFDVRYCLSDTYLVDYYYSSSTTLNYNYYGLDYQEIREEYDTWDHNYTNSAFPHSAFGNGEACYKINQRMGGQYFKQTLGTQKIPYANGSGSTVYLVKQYTRCSSDAFYWVYSNSSSDITDQRNHTFVDSEPYCTACGEAVNPDYDITKDAEGYYLASKVKDIEWLWNLVNVSGVTDAKIKLTADINMAGEAMEPLAEFSGIIDGQNHRLDSITISGKGVDKLGLVSNLSGTVRNLVLSGTVEGTYVSYMGAVAGFVSKTGTVANVLNECTVKATGTMNGSMRMCIGGVAGYVAGIASNCINNGPVVDASTCTGDLIRYIAGVVGYASDISDVNHLINNAVVGASSEATPIGGSGKAVANLFSQTDIHSYYVSGIANPGLGHFYSSSANDYDTTVSQVDVGSGRLAWLLAGKDYDADDAATCFFGQTIGTDMIPYPFVNSEHKGVYKTRHYYTCDSYSDYSNSSTDEKPKAHTWNNTAHYCSVCYVIDSTYMSQDPVTKAYLIDDTDKYNTFATVLNAAYNAGKPMQYASASIQDDLDFSPGAPTKINWLSGRIHGNGHKITFATASTAANIATAINKDGIVEYLDVAFPSDNFYPMVYTNSGQIVGCNITRGIPAAKSEGMTIDCSGELPDSKNFQGRYSRCLVKTRDISGPVNYRLYNSNAAVNEAATYSEIALGQGKSGELAYTLSHGSGNGLWGQKLGTDADPRIYYGQTPASGTYVTRLTSYAAEYPEGNVEYMNAGKALVAAPGYYKVCEDTESWTSQPDYNFIVNNGDGSYSAEVIKLDPVCAHHLPLEVETNQFAYEETINEGEVASLMFPVDIPVSNINGKVYILNGYNTTTGRLEFLNSKDLNFIPANVPFLVLGTQNGLILTGGSYSESYPLPMAPMTGTNNVVMGEISHVASYGNEAVPAGVGDTYYYTLTGANSRHAAPARSGAAPALSAVPVGAEGTTVSSFASYFAVPASIAGDHSESIPVELKEEAVTGIDDVAIDTARVAYPCEVWALDGIKLMTAQSSADLSRLTPGLYILRSDNQTRKISIR